MSPSHPVPPAPVREIQRLGDDRTAWEQELDSIGWGAAVAAGVCNWTERASFG